jgi:acyl-CoA thioesterase I
MAWLRRHRLVAVLCAVLLVAAGVWGVKLVRLASSIEGYRAYWAEPRGRPGGLVYVALGDSAAQGIGASRPDRGYVSLLAERMREQTGRPVQVVNLSSSGATIRDLLDTQLPRLLQLRPDVVTVAIGGNDVRSYDPTRFSAAADELTAALPAGTLIADVPYFMHGGWEERSVQAGGFITAGARAHQLRLVGLHDALRDRGARAMLTDFAADWFHPNDRGHRVWADAFWTELKRSPLTTGLEPASGGQRSKGGLKPYP